MPRTKLSDLIKRVKQPGYPIRLPDTTKYAYHQIRFSLTILARVSPAHKGKSSSFSM